MCLEILSGFLYWLGLSMFSLLLAHKGDQFVCWDPWLVAIEGNALMLLAGLHAIKQSQTHISNAILISGVLWYSFVSFTDQGLILLCR